jgi:7-cyano-7-deazaguanine synthase
MKVVCLVSGGLDSTVLAADLQHDGHDVVPLSIDYGQRPAIELAAARHVLAALQLPTLELDAHGLGAVFWGSALTDRTVPVPHGHYADDAMKANAVPNRNMVLLSLAASLAVSVKADAVGYAAHAGAEHIYLDCRPAFMDAMRAVLTLIDSRPVELATPYATWSKARVVARGASLGAPLGLTYSCYEGHVEHCGKCGACVARREAFQLAGVTDPTSYA